MPRVIFKCPYLKGGSERAASHLHNYVRYMATREGAQHMAIGHEQLPATEEQRKMVAQLLREFPLSRGLFEYEDYQTAPTRGNASEFITRALEDNYDQIAKRDNYVSYIASRPRAQRAGAHAYYAPYVNWAAKTGIVSGTTDTTFAPDTNINREQMAVIMKNYAVKLGYTVPKALEAVTFADNASISSWAKEAVKSMQQAGILAGKTNNRFDPAGTATRAEVATVLRRFVEIVIDPQTANGWQ